MKKADILRSLSEKDSEEIRKVIEHIQENEALQRIERFGDYCAFILKKIEEEAKIEDERKKAAHHGVYAGYIKDIRIIIENHGAPNKKSHLDDYARRLLHELESKEYCSLLENPNVAISYGIVKSHYRELKHSDDYEKHLNHLHGVVFMEKNSKRNKSGIEAKVS